MKQKVKITETYVYYVEIEGNSKKDILENAKDYYENVDDGYTGVADATTLEKTTFKIIE